MTWFQIAARDAKGARRYSGGDSFEVRLEEEEPCEVAGVPPILTPRGPPPAPTPEDKWRQLSPLAAAEVRHRSCAAAELTRVALGNSPAHRGGGYLYSRYAGERGGGYLYSRYAGEVHNLDRRP
eukprot:2865696-Pyramimonas_sp.AAC.1